MRRTIPAIIRSVLEGIPVKRTISVRKRVKKVKLMIKPRIMPSGFLRLPPTDPERTIGSIGKIQGEIIVTIPARKANAKSNNINKEIITLSLFYSIFMSFT